MPSNRALSYALDIIETLDIERIAPQHGGVVSSKRDIKALIQHLRAIKNVGIDKWLAEEVK